MTLEGKQKHNIKESTSFNHLPPCGNMLHISPALSALYSRVRWNDGLHTISVGPNFPAKVRGQKTNNIAIPFFFVLI